MHIGEEVLLYNVLKRELEQVEFNACRRRQESNVMSFGLGVRRVLNLLDAHYMSSTYPTLFPSQLPSFSFRVSLSPSLFLSSMHYQHVAAPFYLQVYDFCDFAMIISLLL